MPNETKYVRGESNSNFESMTKEEILAAIVQAIEGGTIGDVDTGFVTTIKEQNNGIGLKFWVGTTAEYEALVTKETNVLYIKTDDTTADDLNAAITALQTSSSSQAEQIGENTSAIAEHENEITALQDLIDGANAYLESGDPTKNIADIIGDAEDGITVFSIMAVDTTKGYPVAVPVATQSTNRAIVTIIKDNAAMVLFEYDSELYYCHYYTNTQGVQLGDWVLVNDEKDSGWKTLSLEVNVLSASTGAGTPKYRKIGNHVFVRGSVTYTAPSSGAFTIATLPEGYRPSAAMYDLMACDDNRIAQNHINTSGGIINDYIVNVSDGSRYSGTINWVDITMDFFVD